MSQFKVEENQDYYLIRCPKIMDDGVGKELLDLSKNWIENPVRLYILDFRQVEMVQKGFYRQIFLLWEVLKKKNRFVCTINVKEDISKQINETGMENVFSPKADIHQALEYAGFSISKGEVYATFVQPFIKSTELTLEVQTNIKVKPGKPFVKKGMGPTDICIAGIINLTSKAFRGSIALCFPEKVFLKVYSNLVGETQNEITEEIRDAAGEILNIIFGQAKAELNEKEGYQIEKAIPTVVMGDRLRIHQASRNKAVILPFETDTGTFYLEIGVDPV